MAASATVSKMMFAFKFIVFLSAHPSSFSAFEIEHLCVIRKPRRFAGRGTLQIKKKLAREKIKKLLHPEFGSIDGNSIAEFQALCWRPVFVYRR